MSRAARIALVGDFNAAVTAHRAIPEALRLSAEKLNAAVQWEWVPTPEGGRAAAFDAVWCVPASPYASADGALAAIRHAREHGKPFFGTCGGFQHAVLDYARNVAGITGAEHAETAPDAAELVIAELTCPLVEVGGDVLFPAGSRLREIYGADRAGEQYHCNYGVNPRYAELFAGPEGLRAAAFDAAGEVRAVELVGHPFFLATLFQPERAGLRGEPHPLVTAFVLASVRRKPYV